ncbi:hypothetical protein P154DRAFT_243824 [Amniculicola lignicola CBS 123094]|uniref:Uncharacterized protein n=1 Tax=Amniculicola lignicola CBS 123094 TaxID=1392246 RepID=A0A6A5WF39_9PLEO|nr:hypothetical protein P154DRAFT_243824 [Amniculicola lignicola CBS 123094]
MHRLGFFATVFWTVVCVLGGVGWAASEDTVREDRIKVFLFAEPAFFSEVAVDGWKDACVSLDNNLIDGSAQSILIGGHSVPAVYNRTDNWYCNFWDNYSCVGPDTAKLTFADGVNNLASVGWHTKIHAVQCLNGSG